MNQWFERLTEQVSLARDGVTVKKTLQRLAVNGGFKAYAYLSLQADIQTAISSYAPEWQDVYFRSSYFSIDPVIRQARDRMEAFAWNNASPDRNSRERRSFYEHASKFGIRSGITIPIKTGFACMAMLTFASDEVEAAPSQRTINPILAAAAVGQVHSRLAMLGVSPTHHSIIRLRADELTCLRWSAEGKSMRAIAILKKTSYANVAFFLRNAKLALGVTTLPQATAMAAKLGII